MCLGLLDGGVVAEEGCGSVRKVCAGGEVSRN